MNTQMVPTLRIILILGCSTKKGKKLNLSVYEDIGIDVYTPWKQAQIISLHKLKD